MAGWSPWPIPNPLMREFGQMMQRRRNKLGMTVDEVAAKIGRSSRSLERWEAGTTCPLLLDAIAWCEALRMDFWPQLPGEF